MRGRHACMQALDAVLFVISNFQRTFTQRLGGCTCKSFKGGLSSGDGKRHIDDCIATLLDMDEDHLDDPRMLKRIRQLLRQPGMMFLLEPVAKTALESELLFKALKV